MLELDRFSTCLNKAIERHQAGFFFEEGGCFGMAYALYEKFMPHFSKMQICLSSSPYTHAWVHISGIGAFDHQGLLNTVTLMYSEVQLTELMVAAQSSGHSEEHWWDSVYFAQQILESAFELYHSEIPLIPVGMQF